jgi:NADH-quinone oxidoreductase subunit H
MFATSGLAITLFLGGWHAPFPFLEWIPSYAWFFGKMLGLICLFIWVRGTLPRLRMDQLMNFAWKFMLPMALLDIIVAGTWRLMTPGWERWLVCAIALVGPYVLLGRLLLDQKSFSRRSYRYAE